MVGKSLGQKIDRTDVAISFGLSLEPKMDLCQTIDQFGTIFQFENF